MDYVPHVNSNTDEDLSAGPLIVLMKAFLNPHAALSRVQGAIELYQECVSHGLDLTPTVLADNRPHYVSVLLQEP